MSGLYITYPNWRHWCSVKPVSTENILVTVNSSSFLCWKSVRHVCHVVISFQSLPRLSPYCDDYQTCVHCILYKYLSYHKKMMKWVSTLLTRAGETEQSSRGQETKTAQKYRPCKAFLESLLFYLLYLEGETLGITTVIIFFSLQALYLFSSFNLPSILFCLFCKRKMAIMVMKMKIWRLIQVQK